MCLRLLALAACVAALPAAAIEAGGAMPSISVPRLEKPTERFALSSLRGKVVYVDFWASWCVPCRISMPALDALQKKHASEGFAVIGINKDATTGDAERFLKRVPVGFTLVADASDEAARAFDVKTMPSGYLVDRKGVVRHVHRGFTKETAAALEAEVGKLLAEKQ